MEKNKRLRAQPVRTRKPRVVVVGLGPIGVELGRLVVAQPDAFQLVAAVDRAPHLTGRPLRDLFGKRAPRGNVTAEPPAPRGGTGLAFLTTTSSIRSVVPTLEALLERGYHVVSSTEELSYPPLREPRLAARIDRAARKAGRSVVGTGINPGFAMDVWPLVLASNLQALERVGVVRVVDASDRREPLQRKVGAGMSRREFESLARAGRIGHVGLAESCAHLAAALGWALDSMRESLRPCIAEKRIRTAYFDVAPGQVSGIQHRVVGMQGKKRRVTLDLRMELDAANARDEITLDGKPPVHCTVPGGFQGDRATSAQLLSAAARIESMPPGLHLASDLPTPRPPASRLRLSFATTTKRGS